MNEMHFSIRFQRATVIWVVRPRHLGQVVFLVVPNGKCFGEIPQHQMK